jgi:integrase
MPRLSLTDRFVSTCKANSKLPQVDYFDARTPGLALRITSSGHKAWSFLFTASNGKRARVGLGTYPGTSLAMARTKATEVRGIAEAGEDPRSVFSAQAAGAMTAAILIDGYLTKHVRPNLRSAHQVERRFRKNVIPVIGNVRLSDLHRRDINRVLDKIVNRKCPIEANRVFEDIRAALRWAVARGDLDRNPTDGMNAPGVPRRRERVLGDDEIRHLWNALPLVLTKSKACQRIIRLCLATAQRVGEVAGMRRNELDLTERLWIIPGVRTKNGYTHSVPLSELAVDIIKEAIAEAGDAPFVFLSGASPLPPDAVTRTIARAQVRFGLPHWTAHDLRRSAITGMAKLGSAPIVLGHIANHRTTTKAGVTLGVYSHHDYAAEKRQALDLWADRLDAIINADPAKVLPIGAARHVG